MLIAFRDFQGYGLSLACPRRLQPLCCRTSRPKKLQSRCWFLQPSWYPVYCSFLHSMQLG